MNNLYRIEVYDEGLQEWLPTAVASSRETAIAIATKRPTGEKARVVEFEPKQVVTQHGLTVVFDEQGRLVLDGMGRTSLLYRGKGDRTRARAANFGVPAAPDLVDLSPPEPAKPTEPADPIDEALSNFHRKQQGKA